MTDTAKPTDLRTAWHWGVWIGSSLLVVGIIAVALGPVFVNHEAMARIDHLVQPTPKAVSRGLWTDVWLVAQGALVGVIGGGLLALSLMKLHYIRVKDEERASWENPGGTPLRADPQSAPADRSRSTP